MKIMQNVYHLSILNSRTSNKKCKLPLKEKKRNFNLKKNN